MAKTRRSRTSRRGGIVGLLTLVVLALVPMAPAAAIQTISWTTSPPATAQVGGQISFAWSGTANTFLGARITGCFANFADGNNYTNSFGGNFTTGNCSYPNRTLTTPGTHPVTVGFTMSTGTTMTMSWNVSVVAPTPTVSVPSSMTTIATSAQGAPVSFTTSASDSYYGSSATTCTPASGSVFPVGTTTVTCSATNAGGRTGTASFQVTVLKATPTMLWSPPSPVPYGTTYGDLMTAEMQAPDAAGPITYTGSDGTELVPSARVPVGAGHVITATYAPSGPAAGAYKSVAIARSISVEPASSSVVFDTATPTSAQYGDAPFSVDVTGTPGAGTVSVSAQAGSACTVASPATGTSLTATVTITGAGTCVLLADQAATAHYVAAATAQWSVTASKANPIITWTPPAALTYGNAVSDLFAASSDVQGTMTYLIDGVTVAPDTVLDAGVDRVVSVVFTPDRPADYTGATAARTFSVDQAAQSLTVASIADRTFGDAPLDLNIGGAGPGAVSATATGVCSVRGTTVTLVSAGDCSVTVSKAATNNYLATTPVTRTFTIAPAAQTLTVASIAHRTFGDAPFELEIGGTGPGAVSATASGVCTVAGTTVTLVSAGDCSVTATRSATSTHQAASATRTFTIAPATQTLTVSAIADHTFGDGPFDLVIDGTGPGTVAATATGACTSTGVALTLTGAGTCTVTVTKAATSTHQAASVTRTFTVAPKPVVPAPATPVAPVPAERPTVRPVPKITKLSARTGRTAGKKSITIRGTGFTGATSVMFGKVAARFTVKNSTTIVVKSPRLKKGRYDVRVTTSGGTSAKTKADRFTVKK